MFKRFIRKTYVVFFWANSAMYGSSVHAELNLEELQKEIPKLDWKDLHAGRSVVTLDLPKSEVNDAELVVLAAVKAPDSIERVIEKMQSVPSVVTNVAIDVTNAESISRSFQAFQVPQIQEDTLDWFFDPEADGTFNLGKKELQLIQNVVSEISEEDRKLSRKNEQLPASILAALHSLLEKRFHEYYQGGLTNITPYHIKGKNIHPGEYLADSLAPFRLLQRHYANFYRAFKNYPSEQSTDYAHQFFITTEMDGGKPITSLKHWMLNEQEGFTLIAERKYYISHSLDAMHTMILLLPDDQGTYVFLVNATFTEFVTGIGSFVAHKVGRGKVKKNVVPLLESLLVDDSAK